ncbi:hypothetical protein A3Q56_03085, partial [Intoshia linei]
KNLTYLDERPVFPKERACCEAWNIGGVEAENARRIEWIKTDQEKIMESVEALTRTRKIVAIEKEKQRLRNMGIRNPQVDEDKVDWLKCNENDIEINDSINKNKTNVNENTLIPYWDVNVELSINDDLSSIEERFNNEKLDLSENVSVESKESQFSISSLNSKMNLNICDEKCALTTEKEINESISSNFIPDKSMDFEFSKLKSSLDGHCQTEIESVDSSLFNKKKIDKNNQTESESIDSEIVTLKICENKNDQKTYTSPIEAFVTLKKENEITNQNEKCLKKSITKCLIEELD